MYATCDCPYCNKPTKQKLMRSTRTAMYYPPIIDVNGNNINPDGNITTELRQCMECDREFQIKIRYNQVTEIENVNRENDNDPWWIKYQKEDKQ